MAATSMRSLLSPFLRGVLLLFLLTLSPTFTHPVGSVPLKKATASRVKTRQSRAAVFQKDARTLLTKLRSTPQLAASVPFAKDLLKSAVSLPDQSTLLIPVALGQISFLYRLTPADVRQKFIDYHIITSYNKYSDLRSTESGTDLTTQEGSAITKLGRLNGTIVLLQDKGTIPKPIIIPNLLALASFVVHIIPVVLVPKDYA